MEGGGHTLADQGCLRGVFEHHCVACDQCGRHSVDRGHIGVIPRCHDQNEAVRNAFNHAAKRAAIFNNDRGQRIFGDFTPYR